MKKMSFFLIVTLMGVCLAGCASTSATSNNAERPPIGNTIGMSFAEMKRIFGKDWTQYNYGGTDIGVGTDFASVNDYPSRGFLCRFAFKNGEVTQSEAVRAGDLFEDYVSYYVSQYGEPTYKTEHEVRWENKPGIIAYVIRQALPGGIGTYIGVKTE